MFVLFAFRSNTYAMIQMWQSHMKPGRAPKNWRDPEITQKLRNSHPLKN